MTFHHVGCAVRDLDEGLRNYGGILGARRRSRVFDVTSQEVRVCFIELSPGVYLELIAGTGTGSPVDCFLPAGFYHLCFLVDDLAAALAAMTGRFQPLAPFASEAFGGRTCQFVMTADRHLVELAEMPPGEFAPFFESCLAP